MGKVEQSSFSMETGRSSYCVWVAMALLFRVILICFATNLELGSRPEVATPLTSIRRLAEGYWLKQASMSPYAGSMYHGSPLLLPILGPLAVKRIEGKPSHILCSLLFVIVDLLTALLIRATGWRLQSTYTEMLKMGYLSKLHEIPRNAAAGDIASLVYLWNPFTVIVCVGCSTSPIENLMVVLCLYGACSRQAPLAAFGWVMATHLSLYPIILVIPVLLLFGCGPDAPSTKPSLCNISDTTGNRTSDQSISHYKYKRIPAICQHAFSWGPVVRFLSWAFIWSVYVLILSGIFLKEFGGLPEMFKKTYGFIFSVEDLSPNIGILWYFFAEVFVFFRFFFLLVFHMNILFMMLPLAIRLNHRPCFLAFIYLTISAMLKSYPSIGDSALYLALLALFVNELKDIRFSFFLFCGYIAVSLFGPVMHNLWIWRGTGNANFYFAIGIAYACLQTVLVVESVGAMLNHDRKIKNAVDYMINR